MSEIIMEKRFEHGACSKCVFLGQYREHDLYVCTGFDHTVMARFGNDGDYYSGMVFWENPALREAMVRACKLGLIDFDNGQYKILIHCYPEADAILRGETK